ncbi:MAG: ComEC/Rec2 family competence protein [Oscillospiraceae bacterium]|nr:ComEC/Rec2 family competence protein [Oscillospiraceae bacterium]
MKRPLATLGTTVLCSLAAVFAWGTGAGALLLIAASAASIALFFLRRRAKTLETAFAVALAITIGLGAGTAVQTRCDRAFAEYAGTQRTLRVLVTEVSAQGTSVYARGVVQTADGSPERRLSVRFYCYDNIKPGDVADGCFLLGAHALDSASARTVLFAAAQGGLSVQPRENRWLSAAYAIRTKLTVAMTSVLSGAEGQLCAAVLTGDKALLPATLRLLLQRAGVSHMLVVSGLHVSAMLGLLLKLLRKLRASGAVGFFCTLLAAGLLSLFYGFTPSVLRACAMTALVVLAKLVNGRADGFTSLTAAALFIALVDAKSVIDVSFLLSYACCFAIVVIFPRLCAALCRRFPRLAVQVAHAPAPSLRPWARTLLLPPVVNLVTLPVLVLFSMPLSLAAPFSNLLIVPLVPILLALSALTVVLFFLAPLRALCSLCGLAAGLAAKLILAVSRFFAGFSLAAVSLDAGYLRLWVLLACAMWGVFLLSLGAVKARFVCACCAASLFCGVLSCAVLTKDRPCAVLLGGRDIAVCDCGSAGVVFRGTAADEVDYLHADLKYRFIRDVPYVIITEDVGTGVRLRLSALFPSSELVYLTDSAPDARTGVDAAYVRRAVRNAGLTPYFGGSVAADCAGHTLLFCTAAPENPERFELLVYFEDVQPALADGKTVCCAQYGFPQAAYTYAYGGDAAFYFNESGIKAVLDRASAQ